jgi:hypothetical protein
LKRSDLRRIATEQKPSLMQANAAIRAGEIFGANAVLFVQFPPAASN